MRKAAAVYRQLYSPTGATYEDVRNLLPGLVTEAAAAAVPLIGDHGSEGSQAGYLERRAPVLFDAVRSIVERWPQPPDPIRGRSLADLLHDETVAPRRVPSNRAALRELLRRVAGIGGSTGSLRRPGETPWQGRTPVPAHDRRAVVTQALGVTPVLYNRDLHIERPLPSAERVHVYLDVSGSVGHKAALYGAVLDCQEFVQPRVHLFSTQVADVSLAGLRAGECHTTVGTDVACVAGHMRANRVRRAVLVTDGYVGQPGSRDRETLERVMLGVALTPGGTTDNLRAVTNHWTELKIRKGA